MAGLKWLDSLIVDGTKKDKIAAAALLVKLSPVRHLPFLDLLLSVVHNGFNKGKKIVMQVLISLQDLFITVLLPNRKLLFLEQQTIEIFASYQNKVGNRLLLYLYFEDCLKRRYENLVDSIAKLTLDNLEYIKNKSLDVAFNLFYKKPEQETYLLAIIINKLGDPNKKIASKTGYLILSMLNKHPNIFFIVGKEVEKILFRPAVKNRIVFNAISILNQLMIIFKNKKYCGRIEFLYKLLDMYFTLLYQSKNINPSLKTFDTIETSSLTFIKKKFQNTKKYKYRSRVNFRLFSILLTGINRSFSVLRNYAFNFLTKQNVSCLLSMVDLLPSHAGYQALVLLFQLTSINKSILIRLYNVIYNALLTKWVHSPTMITIVSSILLKTLRKESTIENRIIFIKRILHISLLSETLLAPFSLVIISELLRANKLTWTEIPRLVTQDERNIVNFKSIITCEKAKSICTKNEFLKARITRFLNILDVSSSKSKYVTTYGKNPEKIKIYFSELLLVAKHFNPVIASMSRSLMSGIIITKKCNPVDTVCSRSLLESTSFTN